VYYDDSYQNQGRFSFFSLILLVIFVSAAALILAAIIWRPWADDDKPITGTVAEQFGPPAPEAVAPDGVSEVVAGP
jgi:hypothetical protein